MSNQKSEIKNKLLKLKMGVKITSDKFDQIKQDLSSYLSDDPPIDITIIRNLSYTNNVVKKVNSNISLIEDLSKKTNCKDTKNEMNKLFVTSFTLLDSLNQISIKKDIHEYDYEVLTLKILENPTLLKNKHGKHNKLINNYKKDIVETFNSIKVNIIEGFDLGPILNVVESIKDGFEMIVDGLIMIAKFVGELFRNSILEPFPSCQIFKPFSSKLLTNTRSPVKYHT